MQMCRYASAVFYRVDWPVSDSLLPALCCFDFLFAAAFFRKTNRFLVFLSAVVQAERAIQIFKRVFEVRSQEGRYQFFHCCYSILWQHFRLTTRYSQSCPMNQRVRCSRIVHQSNWEIDLWEPDIYDLFEGRESPLCETRYKLWFWKYLDTPRLEPRWVKQAADHWIWKWNWA